MRRFSCARCGAGFEMAGSSHLLGHHRFKRCACGKSPIHPGGVDAIARMTEGERRARGVEVGRK